MAVAFGLSATTSLLAMTHVYQIRNNDGYIFATGRSNNEVNFGSLRLMSDQVILHLEYGDAGVLTSIDGHAPLDWIRKLDPDFTGDDVFEVLETLRIPLDEPNIAIVEGFHRAIAEANQEPADLGFFFNR